jgi:hypothetical protein
MVELYTNRVQPMSGEKTVAVSFRVSPRFKSLLEAAAATEHRSQTNMLEALLFEFCEKHGIEASEQSELPKTVAVGATK